jgi:hypothetical protein
MNDISCLVEKLDVFSQKRAEALFNVQLFFSRINFLLCHRTEYVCTLMSLDLYKSS